ncbi:MAG: hypothetical protein A2341_21145 [Deltaproteobacteria bacterium RIFOXYB12_FULL_58_9]|nr:MAG: hypothetical protein A2341_21145 [Deltaproteobacteria bacterium RIFOXYB12_FULL_58_9]
MSRRGRVALRSHHDPTYRILKARCKYFANLFEADGLSTIGTDSGDGLVQMCGGIVGNGQSLENQFTNADKRWQMEDIDVPEGDILPLLQCTNFLDGRLRLPRQESVWESPRGRKCVGPLRSEDAFACGPV